MEKSFIVILARSGVWVGHSIHATFTAAQQWSACKQHDGEDTAIVEVSKEVMEDFLIAAGWEKIK